ncbi:MAG TPA: glycerol kinase [Acidimicrobiales bacterium]|nr:glycerol kinase [Acidimicrobiales bacterium]
MSILVIDAGTSSVRAVVLDERARVVAEASRPSLPRSPAPGLVEFDPVALYGAALDAVGDLGALAAAPEGVGIAVQRASTVVWDRSTGEPVGPGLGWQDLRTLGTCLELAVDGPGLAPNQSATKAQWLWDQVDPDRDRDLCIGTIDSWLIWNLSQGRSHVTDASNASMTGLLSLDGSGWDPAVASALGLPLAALPRIVDSAGPAATASAISGAPPVTGIAGDQQASMIGQGCTEAGRAKATFGTGAMLDVCVGESRPSFPKRGRAGSFPIVARRTRGELSWALESIMLSAGSCVEWLRDDLGLIDSAADSHVVASGCTDTGDVWFVPALLGLGTPHWDYGARGTLLGLTRGTERRHVVRAVLEGIAHRGADLLDAARTDSGHPIDRLRIDGGMSANPTFVTALADACQVPVEVSAQLEATAMGAGLLAGLGAGVWTELDEAAEAWAPRLVVEPAGESRRDRWREALERSRGWIPELSDLDF